MSQPHHIQPDELSASLSWRYAVKDFAPDRIIPEPQWSALERALLFSPSSYGLQPWRFIVVQDRGTRQRLFESSMGQSKVIHCSHLVVFAARTDITELDVSRWVSRIAEVRQDNESTLVNIHSAISADLITGPRHAIAAEWAKRQVYLSLGVFLASAALLGIDTCPMEGFDPHGYDEILGLRAIGYTATVVAAAGYRHHDDPATDVPKVRFPTSDVLTNA